MIKHSLFGLILMLAAFGAYAGFIYGWWQLSMAAESGHCITSHDLNLMSWPVTIGLFSFGGASLVLKTKRTRPRDEVPKHPLGISN